MRKNTCTNKALPSFLLLLSAGLAHQANAAELYGKQVNQNIKTNVNKVESQLGATRVIYREGDSAESISVSNPEKFPVLIQGKVYLADMKTQAPFIVTPPVFRLNAGQQSRLRIIRTGGDMPEDRETLQWLCITTVPPEGTDIWNQDAKGNNHSLTESTLNVQISTHMCLKLLYRPLAITGDMLDAAADLSWHLNSYKLSVKNTSPFYINFDKVYVGNKEILSADMVPPFSSASFAAPGIRTDSVTWKVLTDQGGESRLFTSQAQP